MKTFFTTIVILFICLSCSTDDIIGVNEKNYVTVQLDYLGDGGVYTDNISGVPYGLVTGVNGPYEFDADEVEYQIQYKPNSSWNTPVTLTWVAHKEYDYTIHCYLEYGNQVSYAHIDVNPTTK
ncbi:hypothetical protein ACLI1A_18480 [Flavobacterium sp. RHBU_3]|uniref:hypothetical protein n=1 Tax=Flavobacterium sp. RHBU_3 TaxID=3391184 RepID=UPI0039851976